MVLKESFGHILKGVMSLKWKLVNQRNKIYHKTYVLLGVQQNLSFQIQPQDYMLYCCLFIFEFETVFQKLSELQTYLTHVISWEVEKMSGLVSDICPYFLRCPSSHNLVMVIFAVVIQDFTKITNYHKISSNFSWQMTTSSVLTGLMITHALTAIVLL